MTVMQWMMLPLRRYARFSGRARPREYWLFVLFLVLAMVVLSIVEGILGLSTTQHWARGGQWWGSAGYATRGGPLSGLFMLAMLVPWLAVIVRRLHDSDRSGWWIFLGLIPLFGGLVLLIFMIIGGTRGPNRFGADPVETGEEPGA